MGTTHHMKTKRLLSGIIFTSVIVTGAFASPTQAGEVDQSIHKLCLEAKDYAGCVRAMKGDTSTRLIKSQGADIAEGNRCPASYAYIGGGNCQRVQCYYPTTMAGGERGHDPIVAGKANWKCKGMSLFTYAGVLRLTGANARASIDPNCPPGEPHIGYNSTCQKPPLGWESPSTKAAREKREGPKCDFRLMAYKCSYNAYLDANPSMKQWAELNPEMAAKERARLQSVD